MNQNPRALWVRMNWLCPSINHLKWLCSNEKTKSITNEKVTPQSKSSSQKSTINEWNASQCRTSSRVTVSPIKALSEMAMPQCRVIPQLPIHHKPGKKTNWLCLSAKRHPTKKLSSMSGVCPSVDNVASENPSLIIGVCPSVNHHLSSPSIMLQGIISD